MGELHKRGSQSTKEFDSQELARLSKSLGGTVAAPTLDDEDDLLKEWGIEPDPTSSQQVAPPTAAANNRLAVGTTPPRGIPTSELRGDARPDGASTAPRTRSATVHDPLTTSVLAEVARQTQAAEVGPVKRDLRSSDSRIAASPKTRR